MLGTIKVPQVEISPFSDFIGVPVSLDSSAEGKFVSVQSSETGPSDYETQEVFSYHTDRCREDCGIDERHRSPILPIEGRISIALASRSPLWQLKFMNSGFFALVYLLYAQVNVESPVAGEQL